METVVSILQDKLKIGRKLCCLIVLGISVLLGLLSCFGYSIWSDVSVLGMQILDFFDFITNSVLMPIIAFIICLFVGYFIKPKAIIEEAQIGGKFKQKNLFTVIIRYVAPVCILFILISSVLDAFDIINI